MPPKYRLFLVAAELRGGMEKEEQLQAFTDALGEIGDAMHRSGSFWSELLGMARRILASI